MAPCKGCGKPTPQSKLKRGGRCVSCQRAFDRLRLKEARRRRKLDLAPPRGRHYNAVPEASPERMARLACELGQVRDFTVICAECGKPFTAKLLRDQSGLFCPACIERRVAQVVAERWRQSA